MRNHQIIKGVRVKNSTGLPSIDIKPEDTAIGNVPGWNTLLDPDYVFPDKQRVLNRVNQGQYATSRSGGGIDGINTGTMTSGETGFESGSESSDLLGIDMPTAWNPTAWTFFAVCEFKASEQIQYLVRSTEEADAGEFSPAISFNVVGDAIRVWDRYAREFGEFRLSATNPEIVQYVPFLVMVTFSVDLGLKIWKDGEILASDPTATEPLTTGYQAGEWSVLRNCRKRFGYVGLLDVDLSAEKLSGDRRALERFVMDKYDIPEGS